MTKANPTYLGPLPGPADNSETTPGRIKSAMKRVSPTFVGIVVLPTLVAALYYFLIATPQYVSESRFIVRASSQESPSSLGVALQGVGISTAQTDAFVVHEYIRSRDALRDLQARRDIKAVLAPPGADFLSRFPRPWEGRSQESLYKGFQRFLTVGYDSTTGLSTLRVEAFNAKDARAINDALLTAGEQLVNRLNERASAGAVADAERTVVESQLRLTDAQRRLTAFRSREQIIDPTRAATEGSQMVGDLMSSVAVMRAERAQLAQEAPNSPQLPLIDNRIRAYEAQIAQERTKIAGNTNSLAPKIDTYEQLGLERELADRALTTSTQALDRARLDARRQRLYLERVVSPSLPDSAAEPKRWMALLTIFATMLLVYGTVWLISAGVREHRQV